MQKYFLMLISLIFFSFTLVFTGCPDLTTTTSTSTTINMNFVPVSKSDNVISEGASVFHVETSGCVALDYTLELGDNTKDVYFVFTNISNYDSVTNPYVKTSYELSNSTSENTLSLYRQTNNDSDAIYSRRKPFIDEFNRNPFSYIDSSDLSGTSVNRATALLSNAASDDYDGKQMEFYTDSVKEKVVATCRTTSTNGTKKLNIWVADDCWYTNSTRKAYTITPAMVDLLSRRFLSVDTSNDIYNWVTNIFGEEWGNEHTFQNLISADNNITILLYDIDSDNSTNGGTLGYFYGKDNFLKTSYSFSNERIIFYIDAVLFATPDTGHTWSISAKWPMQCISTLAHEFQHMIHFYQKMIKRVKSSNSETYLNEMCSLVTEDFVADKLGTDGPRGVAYNMGSAGSSQNINGRLPTYNSYNSTSLIDWDNSSTDNALKSYAVNYAFGAYLARNFGGVKLFRDIVWNDKTDYEAINYALKQGGYSEDFFATLKKWGAAVILSDLVSGLPEKYICYNKGDYFVSSLNGISYNLGSINLFNYKNKSGYEGPFLNTNSNVGREQGLYSSLKSSNLFYAVGMKQSKTIKRKINIEENIRLTVVVK